MTKFVTIKNRTYVVFADGTVNVVIPGVQMFDRYRVGTWRSVPTNGKTAQAARAAAAK